MLTDQLEEKTKRSHQLLEGKINPKIKAIQTPEDYSQVLILFYTYFGGLELLIDKYIDLVVLPDYSIRRKTASLALDLHALNTPLPMVADMPSLPVVENNLQALGALYVLERSTLGGSFISKMIGDKLVFTDASRLGFFNGYGSPTAGMWASFRQALDALVLQPGDADTILTAANDTFLLFCEWVDGNNGIE
ncbi:MAG: biliverdin-producing heme oxygenase [Chitinophagaceae bacterium]